MAYHAPPAVWSRCLWVLWLSTGLLLGVLRGSSAAQITLDGSVGPQGPLHGPHYRIGAELGQLRGSNLFHSFGAFNVPTGGSATFTGPNGIANILGRVTGGQPSSIDGLLRSEIAGANLYLLNPNGVLFGPNASLDVRGSFYVSTADYLRFADGAQFFANLGQESVLTVAPPTAFGFLGNNPAAITIQGSTLRVPDGKAVSVVGGDIEIMGNAVLTSFGTPTLGARGGRINLASVASPGEVLFSPLELAPDLQVDGFARLGRITLSQDALLDGSGDGGGTVLIRGGRLLVDRSNVFADNTGPVHGTGLGLDLPIIADAVIENGSLLTTDSLKAGRARDLRLIAGSVYLGQSSGLVSRAFSDGDAGSIAISTPLLTMEGGVIQARAESDSRGNAGSLEVQAGRLALTGGAQISTSTRGEGRGGELTVTATEAITIGGRSSRGDPSALVSNTSGLGDAGRLRVVAPTLTLEGEPGSTVLSGALQASTVGRGKGGDIEVRVGRLTLTEGTEISTGTRGEGRGGDLTVVATEAISIAGRPRGDRSSSGLNSNAFASGDAGRLFISTPLLTMEGGGIQALTEGRGNAGSLEVQVDRLALTGGAQISTNTFSEGRGGALTVTATDTIAVAGENSQGNPSQLSSSTVGPGDAGAIEVRTGSLMLSGGGQIASNSGFRLSDGTILVGSGRAGSLTITAKDFITISGSDLQGNESGLYSNTFGSGDAGRLLISAPLLTMDEGLIEAVAARGSRGNAGDIEVRVDRLALTGGAEIGSSTFGTGRGGQVTVAAAETIELSHGGTITAISTGDGAAGTLRLRAGDTFRSQDGAVTTASARAGGGRIELQAGRLVQLRDSELTTTVQGGGGDAGNLTLTAPFVVAEDSRIVANAFGGMGGNVLIDAGVFLRDPASLVSASSALGLPGTVDIRAPVTSLSGTLAPLPQAFVSVAALLPARCAARAQDGRYSSLVLGGREGLPVDPGGLLPSPFTLDARLMADPTGIGALPRQPSTARFALLAGHEQALPRLGCPP